jgi:hypothetical protein
MGFDINSTVKAGGPHARVAMEAVALSLHPTIAVAGPSMMKQLHCDASEAPPTIERVRLACLSALW